MQSIKDVLIKAGAEINLEFNSRQLDLYEKYYELLIEGNNKFNLTTITEPTDVAVKHFIDSLTCLTILEFPEGASVLDVGTGAGFPGIPLKIFRQDLKITLMDSLGKKVNFLNETIQALGLQDIKGVHARAEDFGRIPEVREKYDFVISRAVAKLQVLAEYCLPCVKQGGYFISQKGPEIELEVKEANKAIERLGGSLKKVQKLNLPIIRDGRSLIVIKKEKNTPKEYPRKAGTPGKKPII